jgi:hypothetical protein
MLDDELEPETLASVEAHLRDCASCADELRRLRSTIALLHAVQRPRAPAGFVERVIAAAQPVPRWRRALRRLVFPLPVKLPLHAAAAVLLAVGVGYLLQRTPELRDAAHVSAPVSRENDVAPPAARVPSPEEEATARRSAAPASPAPARPEPPAQRMEQGPAPGEIGSRLRDDAERSGQNTERTVAKSASPSVAAREARAATAEGELGVASRDGARRAVHELAARHGARVVAEGRIDAAEVIRVHVPRDQYDTFVHGLTALGRWRSSGDPAAGGDGVELTIRLVD